MASNQVLISTSFVQADWIWAKTKTSMKTVRTVHWIPAVFHLHPPKEKLCYRPFACNTILLVTTITCGRDLCLFWRQSQPGSDEGNAPWEIPKLCKTYSQGCSCWTSCTVCFPTPSDDVQNEGNDVNMANFWVLITTQTLIFLYNYICESNTVVFRKEKQILCSDAIPASLHDSLLLSVPIACYIMRWSPWVSWGCGETFLSLHICLVSVGGNDRTLNMLWHKSCDMWSHSETNEIPVSLFLLFVFKGASESESIYCVVTHMPKKDWYCLTYQ